MTQTLEQLSAAATQGEWTISGLEQSTQIWAETYVGETRDYNGNDADFIVALVNAYRTGQLVAVADDAIERVKAENEALRIALHDAIRRPMGVVPASADQLYSPAMADEAETIRALKSPKPQIL